MTSRGAFFAVSFLIVGIVNSFVINNGDIPSGVVGAVSEIVESDEAKVAPRSALLWDSLLVTELKRIIKDQEASGNEESLERISREAHRKSPIRSRPKSQMNGTRFRPCYFNPISCFKR